MRRHRFSGMRQLGLLVAIPALMVVAPLVGLFAGQWVDGRLRSGPWGTVIGLVLGFAAAVREIRLLIRKAQEPVDRDPPDRSADGP